MWYYGQEKKYPKLPNGYGSIKYLGKGRHNPYAVHPPTTEFTVDGVPITPKALCYMDDWMMGFSVLTAYKAGTYYPGIEKTFTAAHVGSDDSLIQKILADYNLTKAADDKLAVKKRPLRRCIKSFLGGNLSRIKAGNTLSQQKSLQMQPIRIVQICMIRPLWT